MPLGVLIQKLEVMRPIEQEGRLTVFHSGEPYLTDAVKISSVKYLQDKLVRWQGEPSDNPGCWTLHTATDAKPNLALTDLTCPTLLVIRELKRRGWTTIAERCSHTRANMEETIFSEVNLHMKNIICRWC